MRLYKDKKRSSFFTVLLILSAVVVIALILVDAQIRPLLKKVCSYQGNLIATNIITQAVYNAMNDREVGYSTLVKLSTTSDGHVSSLESNMLEINKLQTSIVNCVNIEFQELSNQTIQLSTGTLSGVNVLYGRGPKIKFKLQQVGYVKTQLVSKFTSAGVNQTLHQIILEVNSMVSAVIPGYTTSISVKSNYIIAETIIVGNIPESYTYITGDNRDTLTKINDYSE